MFFINELAKLENLDLTGMSRKAYKLHLELINDLTEVCVVAASSPRYVLANAA